jgi:hypothetical protein
VADSPTDLPFFRLVEDGLGLDAAGAARAKFIGEAALVGRAVGLIGTTSDARLDAVMTAVESELNGPRQMSLADNSLRMADLLYPYAAVRDRIPLIPFYEVWLDAFERRRPPIPDRPDYRVCEDQFILYMARRGKLPAFYAGSLSSFYKRVYDFTVEQCYWLTHRYIYSTDLGEFDAGIGWIAPALLIIVGKAALWDNMDLFYEAAFCALSTNLNRECILAIDGMAEGFRPRVVELQKANHVYEVYHELFVYSLFRLRRDRLDAPGTGEGDRQAAILTEFVGSLASKSSDRIVRAYRDMRTLSDHGFLAEVCLEKLNWLKEVAQARALFENEIRVSGGEAAPGLYEEYVGRVNLDLETLLDPTASTPGAMPTSRPPRAATQARV